MKVWWSKSSNLRSRRGGESQRCFPQASSRRRRTRKQCVKKLRRRWRLGERRGWGSICMPRNDQGPAEDRYRNKVMTIAIRHVTAIRRDRKSQPRQPALGIGSDETGRRTRGVTRTQAQRQQADEFLARRLAQRSAPRRSTTDGWRWRQD